MKKQWLYEWIDPKLLGIFRIVFGLFMAYEMLVYFQIGLIRNMFVLPAINFQYDFFRWVKPLPEFWMIAILSLMLVCSLAITVGFFFRWACRLFALGYVYILLLDKSIFNNHIYLFILLALLLSFTEADRILSLRKKSSWVHFVPRWQVFILQLQIVIVYFYGGIAKLTHDWLVRCQPIRTLAAGIPEDLWLSSFAKSEAGIYLVNYGGLFIDLAAPFLLWYKPVRKWAIFTYILFHVSNAILFSDIGIFPYVMLVSLILFYNLNDIPFLRRWSADSDKENKSQKKVRAVTSKVGYPDKPVKIFLTAYFIFQLLFPLRAFFLPNDMDWTTIGNRFSWRMKVSTKQIEEMTFMIYDPVGQLSYPVDIRNLVNDMQVLNMALDPRSVADFAKLLESREETNGVRDPQVMALIRVRYNGRGSQYFVDPDKNMAEVDYPFYKRLDWVLPVQE